ncbi:hypothetical protein ACIBSW_13185 [Actinoplanes sp. NPDC049668]|uniref:hypothetical protein n=1 Tax=unclassified Actinoplanes TaxID=2626549 RepID=UPI0033ADC3EE
MAGNTMTLEFAGDATKLQQAAKKAQAATDDVAAAAKNASTDYDKAGDASDRYGSKLGDLGAATTGAMDAIDALGGGLQAVADVQDYARDKAARLARANVDVMQATEDMAQATRDAKQATIDSDQAVLDATQAKLDQKTALDDYNAAVKEHGKNSAEARQADIDLKQAGIDLRQAQEDQAQATRDASQANIDAKTAQVDLNDAMHEANPPELQEWADKMALVTPLLTAMMGATALVTAAQWAWNIAQLASPTTWIILAIVALIAIIVLIATKTDWFQRAWRASWGWIKKAASNTWDFLKKIPGWLGTAFSKIAGFITAPFRMAFNFVADAWNNTIGRLSWSVPGWVPGIGGNSISVPKIPKFHSGGVMPGAPGSEGLALLQAGETITPAGSSSGGRAPVYVTGDGFVDALIRVLADRVTERGGSPRVLGITV